MTFWMKAIALWFGILVLATMNGVLREKVLMPSLGTRVGLIASGCILSGCIFCVAWVGAAWYAHLTSAQWLTVGTLWLALTLGFEFGFGRLVQHKTWAELFQAYTFEAGNIWPLVLLVTFVAPWCVAKIRGLA